jgi:hypothetical protein
MKKLLLIAVLTSLNGCALISAYNMAHFDNNEYALVNNVRTTANIGLTKCGTADEIAIVDSLYYTTEELKNYSAGIGNNELTVKMTTSLAVIVAGLETRYHGDEPVSPAYCKIKLESIEKDAKAIQTAIGAKPR